MKIGHFSSFFHFFFHFWRTLVRFLFSLQSCRLSAPSTEDSESSVIADQVEKNIDAEPTEPAVDLKILADPFFSTTDALYDYVKPVL